MTESNTPQGTGLSQAQNAISAMLAPPVDNAPELDALQAENTEVVDEAEMLDDADEEQSLDAEAGDLDGDEYEDENQDQSQDFDIMATTIDVDGEEITVEGLKSGFLRQRDYTRKTQALSEERNAFTGQVAELDRERAQYAEMLPRLAQQI